MVASLYPQPLGVDETLELDRHRRHRGQRTQKLSGGQTQRVRFAIALVSEPRPARPRRADRRDGRREPARLLGDDARVRVARQDGPLRHALPRGGGRLRRPRRPDGGGQRRRRRADDGDQGDGGHAHDPRDAAGRRRSTSSAAAGRHARRAARRGGRPRAAPTRTPRSARCSRGIPARPRLRDQRRRPRRGVPGADGDEPSCNSATYVRYELLRTFRNRRFFIFSLGFPLVLYFLIAGPNRHENDLGGTGISRAALLHGRPRRVRPMNAMLGAGARIAGERAVGWNRQLRLTPLSTRAVLPRRRC